MGSARLTSRDPSAPSNATENTTACATIWITLTGGPLFRHTAVCCRPITQTVTQNEKTQPFSNQKQNKGQK
jgi:hypothetical protein